MAGRFKSKEEINHEVKEKDLSESLSDNLSVSSSSSSGSKDLPSLLSDAGTYSYAAIIALTLHELFDNQWDRKFNLQCISVLLQHLNLPKQVR